MLRPVWWTGVALAFALAIALAARPARAQQRVFPPGQEARILAMVAPYQLGKTAADGLELYDAAIEPTRVTWTFRRDGAVVARLVLELSGVSANVRSEPALDRLPPALQPAFRRLLEQVGSRAVPAAPPTREHGVRSLFAWALGLPVPFAVLLLVLGFSVAGWLRARVESSSFRYWTAAALVSVALALAPIAWVAWLR